jgi:hypothetical protein
MAKIDFPDKQTYVSGAILDIHKVSANDINALKNALNNNTPDLVGGKIPDSQLKDVYFSGMTGDGTQENPFRPSFNLASIPGYQQGTTQVLYSTADGFLWGAVPSGGSLPQLNPPSLTLGTPQANTIPLSWTAVTNAVQYVVERATQSNFSGAVQVYQGVNTSYADFDLSPSTTYYYRVKAIAGGYTASAWDTESATTASGGLITPPAPSNGIVNDVNDTFDFTFASGYTSSLSDYEYTLDGGTTWNSVGTKPIAIGNIAKAIGQVGVRVKGVTGTRNPSSPLYNTVAFTVAAGAELGQPVIQFQYLSNMISNGSGTVERENLSNSGAAALTFAITNGQVGFASMSFPTSFTGEGEGSTAIMSMGVGIDPHFGDPSATYLLFRVWAQTGGGLVYTAKGGSDVYTANGVVSANGIIRIRVDLDTAYLEVSNNGGTSWNQIATTSRLPGTLRVKLNAQGNQHKVINLRSYVQ